MSVTKESPNLEELFRVEGSNEAAQLSYAMSLRKVIDSKLFGVLKLPVSCVCCVRHGKYCVILRHAINTVTTVASDSVQ